MVCHASMVAFNSAFLFIWVVIASRICLTFDFGCVSKHIVFVDSEAKTTGVLFQNTVLVKVLCAGVVPVCLAWQTPHENI